ncbi:phenylacetate--CoA ligase family protein [Candidatus Woesearchaeota archaeon]|nr:phenylacetate--CoA ligase family protein [Candidatus Woesearchaeota archaeon]
MTIINSLQKRIFRLNYLLKNKGKNWRLYHEQLGNQYKPIDELEKIQLENLKKIVKHAYDYVPFYKRLYDKAGIKPGEIRSLTDINKLPVITKADLKKVKLEDIIAKNISKDRWFRCTTSGSTGEPFMVISDRDTLPVEHAAWLRELSVMGYKIGDRIAKIRAHEVIKEGKFSRLVNRNLFVKCIDMEQETEKHIEVLKKFRPDIIETYCSTAFHIAKYLVQSNDSIKIKGIQIIGTHLSEEQKSIMRKAFCNARICLDYGAAEIMRVAYQCELEQGYHIDTTRFVIELVRNGKPAEQGQEGEMVVTNLENYAMPFIRYRIKDSAVFTSKKCKCGRSFPLLKDIKGRLVDNLVTPSGKIIRIGLFMAVFSDEHEYVDKFQVIKENQTQVLVKIQPTRRMTRKKLQEIKNRIKEKFGDELEVKVKLAKKIPLAQSGKAILIKNKSTYNLGGFD